MACLKHKCKRHVLGKSDSLLIPVSVSVPFSAKCDCKVGYGAFHLLSTHLGECVCVCGGGGGGGHCLNHMQIGGVWMTCKNAYVINGWPQNGY